MRSWLKGTFSDAEGVPSFKRQISFILVIACITGMLTGKDIEPLSLLVALILGATSAEKFKEKK